VPIDQFDVGAPFWYRALEVVAETIWPGSNLLKYAANDRLLVFFRSYALIKFHEAWFAMVVDYDDTFNHRGRRRA